jgi:hypothetical protein
MAATGELFEFACQFEEINRARKHISRRKFKIRVERKLAKQKRVLSLLRRVENQLLNEKHFKRNALNAQKLIVLSSNVLFSRGARKR